MSRVRVLSVDEVNYAILKKNPPDIVVTAAGTVPTSGWKNGELDPWIYIQPPKDGILDMDFTAKKPTGFVMEVISPISADTVMIDVDIENFWGDGKPLAGFRIHATDNSKEVHLNGDGESARAV